MNDITEQIINEIAPPILLLTLSIGDAVTNTGLNLAKLSYKVQFIVTKGTLN